MPFSEIVHVSSQFYFYPNLKTHIPYKCPRPQPHRAIQVTTAQYTGHPNDLRATPVLQQEVANAAEPEADIQPGADIESETEGDGELIIDFDEGMPIERIGIDDHPGDIKIIYYCLRAFLMSR